MSTDSISLQATIGGMSAASPEVYTLLGQLDRISGVLLVDAAVRVKPGTPERRIGGSAAVTNNTETQDRDALFTEADIRDAINAYMDFAGRGLLVLAESVSRFNPQSALETDGLDSHGRKYRISPEMNNGRLAVLALCWYAFRQSNIGATMAQQDDYADLFDITTIGMGPNDVNDLRIRADGWPEE